MKCPNCNKEYHWCWNCGWPAGEFACSYDCAEVLWCNGKISAKDMAEWDVEKISADISKSMFKKARAAKPQERKVKK